MAWTTPRNWTSGELVTEAMMDTHVKDNMTSLWEAQRFVQAYRNTTFAAVQQVWTEVVWDLEIVDDWTGFTAGNTYITVPTGVTAVAVHATVAFTGQTGTVYIGARIGRRNSGGGLLDYHGLQGPVAVSLTSGGNTYLSTHAIVIAAATDRISVEYWCDASGTAGNFNNGARFTVNQHRVV